MPQPEHRAALRHGCEPGGSRQVLSCPRRQPPARRRRTGDGRRHPRQPERSDDGAVASREFAGIYAEPGITQYMGTVGASAEAGEEEVRAALGSPMPWVALGAGVLDPLLYFAAVRPCNARGRGLSPVRTRQASNLRPSDPKLRAAPSPTARLLGRVGSPTDYGRAVVRGRTPLLMSATDVTQSCVPRAGGFAGGPAPTSPAPWPWPLRRRVWSRPGT